MRTSRLDFDFDFSNTQVNTKGGVGNSCAGIWHGMVVADEYIIQEAAEHSIDRNIR